MFTKFLHDVEALLPLLECATIYRKFRSQYDDINKIRYIEYASVFEETNYLYFTLSENNIPDILALTRSPYLV